MSIKTKKDLKITVIGSGSSYTPELIEGLLNRKDDLPISELWLVDIDMGWEKATIIAGLTKRMIEKVGSNITVHLTKDRKVALENADFVCSQFRVGGLDARNSDEAIANKYNMIGQETNGLGGFANACRTIPVALEIAKEMEVLSPNPWLLNFTNPSGMVTEALLKYSSIKTVGLCNVPVIMQRGAASMLHVEQNEMTMQVAGLNHLIWARKVLVNGEDKIETLIHEILNGNDQMVPQNIPKFDWPELLLKEMGMIPCAYLRYYYISRDIISEELAETAANNNRAQQVKKIEKELFNVYRDQNLNRKPKMLEKRGGAYYSEAACELMSSIFNNKHNIMHVNTRNNGAIQGLPDDCAVEVSSVITSAGILPLNVEPFPRDTLCILQTMKEFETLTVEAAIHGDLKLAYRAFLLNPLVDTGAHIEEAFKECVMANLEHMPQFKHLLN